MDAKICDKCGKTFKEINQTVKFVEIDNGGRSNGVGKTIWESKPGVHITIDAFTKSPFARKQYDLCPECAEKIIEFFSSGTYPWKEEE